MTTEVCIQLTDDDKQWIPHYASNGAVGADVRACITEDVVIPPGETALVSTGIKMAIPDGFEIQVRPRSGLALRDKITVLNTPGTIDPDYRGEVGVILINHGKEAYTVTRGQRIAQLVLVPVAKADFTLADELATTARGSGGFGHTGTN